MNQVLSLVRAARTSSHSSPCLYSNHMLAELLALHEEMLSQLQYERVGFLDNSDLRAEMIDQHERAAATIRAQLENHEPDTSDDSVLYFGR